MKKLLSLVLVLAVASLASAMIVSPMEIVDNLDGTYAINMPAGLTVANDGPAGGYFALIGVDGSTASVVGPGLLYDGAALNLGTGPDVGLEAGIVGGFTTTGTMVNTAAGIYATGFTALPGVQLLQLVQLDDGYTPVTVVSEFVIPEPATVALLTLGGLLLRRKK